MLLVGSCYARRMLSRIVMVAERNLTTNPYGMTLSARSTYGMSGRVGVRGVSVFSLWIFVA